MVATGRSECGRLDSQAMASPPTTAPKASQQTETLSKALIRNSNRRQRVRLLFAPTILLILLPVAVGLDGEVASAARLLMISAAGAFIFSLVTWFKARSYPHRIERALTDPRLINRALAYPNGLSSCVSFGIEGERPVRFQKVDRATVDRFAAMMTEAAVPLQMFSGSRKYVKALRQIY